MRGLRMLIDIAIRPFATAANRIRRRLRPPTTGSGAHALALTPDGRIILVKLRYAPGWRLPGGGRSEDERLHDVALRELREEIGMTGHGAVRSLAEIDRSLILVEDVHYSPPRWSWEVEQVIEADRDNLPRDLAPVARRWIAALERSG
jgi:8-oxo-dGTP pyrophosphatase MutT (NUDIX family)